MTAIKIRDCHCDNSELNPEMLSVNEGIKAALELVSPVKQTELVSLADALGRIASNNLHAPRPMPFFDNSAMDGYAVQTAHLGGNGPYTLTISGESAAGSAVRSDFNCRCAVRIFTGAPVPKGFDAVIAQENCRVANGQIQFDKVPRTKSNIRYMGVDVARGNCLIKKGTRIAPHHIGLLAANGYSNLNVFAKPRVAVFSTGDELIMSGKPIRRGQIYDCNNPMLIALFAAMGIEAVDQGALPDDSFTTCSFLAGQKDEFDLVVSTGSVSVGERDFLKPAFEAAGGLIKGWKVAVKPGKPVMFGILGCTAFTGLPGNPFAVFVGFNLFVKPQLLKLSGHLNNPGQWQSARAGFTWTRKPGRCEVFPVKRMGDPTSSVAVLARLGQSASATLYPLADSDGLGMVPAECDEIRIGDQILWQSFC